MSSCNTTVILIVCLNLIVQKCLEDHHLVVVAGEGEEEEEVVEVEEVEEEVCLLVGFLVCLAKPVQPKTEVSVGSVFSIRFRSYSIREGVGRWGGQGQATRKTNGHTSPVQVIIVYH